MKIIKYTILLAIKILIIVGATVLIISNILEIISKIM